MPNQVPHHEDIVCLIKHVRQINGGWGNRYAPLWILNSALDRGECLATRPSNNMPCGENLQYLLEKRLGGSQNQSGHSGEEKKSLHCPCYINPSCPAHSIVTILTELLWL
jgi:hypothetical protein